jgi:cytochrome d ubiquinol oxidase subunit II
MELTTLWFGVIAFLFVGYFVLDGFDFGVGMSLPFLAKDDTDRRVLINTIGPVWDLNETWLIVAGAALFAAFPEWYATMFSGFYLLLVAILITLILRGVSFEFRHQGASDRWRGWFDAMIVVGSVVPSFLWGVVFANVVRGVPMDRHHDYTGSTLDLLNPYALLGGLTTLSLFLVNGLQFAALKTDGPIRARARLLSMRVGAVTIVIAAAFLVWTTLAHGSALSGLVSALAAVALVGSYLANVRGRERWAFGLLALTIALAVASLFTALHPYVMPASNDPAYGLTLENASSSPYTLTIMTWAAGFALPLILAYQAWTYWVFRKRITRAVIAQAAH